MTLPIIELLMALLLAYCAIICVKLTAALTGKNEPGTHCSGSLVALGIGIVTYFAIAVLSGIFSGVLGAGILGRLFGGGAGTVAGGGGSSGETPGGSTPEEPTPGPGEPGAPGVTEIPGMIGPLSYTTQPAAGALA